MPTKVKWGIGLFALLLPNYVLLSVNRSVFDGYWLGRILEAVLWLAIAAGWVAGPILIIVGLALDRPRSPQTHDPAAFGSAPVWNPHTAPLAPVNSDALRARLNELAELLQTRAITQAEHDELGQRALNTYARGLDA